MERTAHTKLPRSPQSEKSSTFATPLLTAAKLNDDLHIKREDEEASLSMKSDSQRKSEASNSIKTTGDVDKNQSDAAASNVLDVRCFGDDTLINICTSNNEGIGLLSRIFLVLEGEKYDVLHYTFCKSDEMACYYIHAKALIVNGIVLEESRCMLQRLIQSLKKL